MSERIINHPWGQSQDWTGDVDGYSPTHWLSGTPNILSNQSNNLVGSVRPPYGYTGEMSPTEPQTTLENDSEPAHGPGTVTSGTAPSQDLPAPGIIYAPEPYDQYAGNQQVMDLQTQNQNTDPKEEKIDWYKIIYTASIVLMGVGSIAVAAIQYKSYMDKRKDSNNRGFHHDVESESEPELDR